MLCKMILHNHLGLVACQQGLRASVYKKTFLTGQNTLAAKCLKLSGCGVHLEIAARNFILRTNKFGLLERKCSSFPG